jgi:hypothetical protein
MSETTCCILAAWWLGWGQRFLLQPRGVVCLLILGRGMESSISARSVLLCVQADRFTPGVNRCKALPRAWGCNLRGGATLSKSIFGVG